jgi:hypothetical protein
MVVFRNNAQSGYLSHRDRGKGGELEVKETISEIRVRLEKRMVC